MSAVKHYSRNPLKLSQPAGAALAFLGVENAVPLIHGSQGCTAFNVVLFVRHFREPIPIQTTAMNEVTTILGGEENLEEAILNIVKRANPAMIGICSTGLTETKGDDLSGFLVNFRKNHPELENVALVYASTPDYTKGLEEGWRRTAMAMVSQLAAPGTERTLKRINLFVGSHLTPGDIEELRELSEAFGLEPVVFPDLSSSFSGNMMGDAYLPATSGGTTVDAIRGLGSAEVTIAFGEQMRDAAAQLETKTGVPYVVFRRLSGLAGVDEFVDFLVRFSGKTVPAKILRQRESLMDAMLDCHFYFSGKTALIGAENDLLYDLGLFLADCGCTIEGVTTDASPESFDAPALQTVVTGDLDELEKKSSGADLLLTNSHGDHIAKATGLPHYRIGYPVYDRLGNHHLASAGYRGSRRLLYDLANLMYEREVRHHVDHGERDRSDR